MRQQFHSAVLIAFLHLALFLTLARAQPLDVVQLGSTSYYVIENAGSVAIQIQRTGPMTDYATVDLRTASLSGPNSAATNDFEFFAQTVEFEPGQSNLTVMIEIFNDALVEVWELFDIVLSDPDPFCCQLGPRTLANVHIQDNDLGVQFGSSSYWVSENAGDLRIEVSRFGDMLNEAGSITFETIDQSARRDVDFVITTNRVHFLAGQTNGTIIVSIPNDVVPRDPKEFLLRFEPSPDPLCCSLGSIRETTVRILDNDRGVEFSSTLYQVPEEMREPVIELQRGGDFISVECTVEVEVIDWGAKNGLDYSLGMRTFTFAAGQSNLYVPLLIHNDAVREEPEDFTVYVADGLGNCARGSQYFARVWIQDNDYGVEFARAFYAAVENEAAVRVGLQRLGDATNEFAVSVSASGSAQPQLDFLLPANRLYFAAGQTNLEFTVPLLDDPLVDRVKRLMLSLSEPSGDVPLGATSNVLIEIRDNEAPVNLMDPHFKAAQSATRVALRPDGKLVIVSGQTVSQLSADGTPDLSFTPLFLPNSIHTVALDSDGSVIVAGTISWEVGGGRRYGIARLSAAGVLDETFAPALNSAEIKAVRIQPDGRLLIGGRFYKLDRTERAIARLGREGAWDDTFDALVDPPWVELMLLQADGRIVIGGNFRSVNGQPRAGIARVENNGALDPAFDARFSPYTTITAMALQPDGKIVLSYRPPTGQPERVVRLNASDGTLDVSFAVFSPNDLYVLGMDAQPDGKILILGDMYDEVTRSRPRQIVRLNSDGSLDGSFASVSGDRFVLCFDGHIYTTVANVVTRLITEVPDFSVWFLHSATGVLESESTSSLTIHRGGESGSTISVDFVTGGAASAGLDYAPATGTITFAPLETTKVIAFEVFKDCLPEPHETIQVMLTNPGAGGFIAAPGHAALTIVDDDATGGLDGFNPGPNWVSAMALLLDGKVLLGVNAVVNKVNPDGSPDSSFQAPFLPYDGSGQFYAYPYPSVDCLSLQPDGKILVGGSSMISRLHADGAVDPSFKAELTLHLWQYCDGGHHGHGGIGHEECGPLIVAGQTSSMIVQPDGKILVQGSFSTVNGGWVSTIARSLVAGLVRLNADSTLDTNFIAFRSGSVMQLLPDGKLLVGGYGNWVSRLLPNGSNDQAFTNVTVSATNWSLVNDLLVFADQKILVAGRFTTINGQGAYSGLARLNADGSLDMNFNPVVRIPEELVHAHALAMDAKGRILLAGEFDGSAGFRLVRLFSDGTVDLSFGHGLRFAFPISAIIEQPHDGNLLVTGNFADVNGVVRRGIARVVGERSHIRLWPPARQADGSLLLVSGSHVGESYVLQSSGDLIAWTSLSTNVANDCTVEFGDPRPASAGFYRVVKLEP